MCDQDTVYGCVVLLWVLYIPAVPNLHDGEIDFHHTRHMIRITFCHIIAVQASLVELGGHTPSLFSVLGMSIMCEPGVDQ